MVVTIKKLTPVKRQGILLCKLIIAIVTRSELIKLSTIPQCDATIKHSVKCV